MGWIIGSIIEVLLSIVSKLVLFALELYDNISIDIGYKVVNKSTKTVGLFDEVFPYASYFIYLFLAVGIALALAILFLNLFKIMITPEAKEHPASLIGKSLISIFCVAASYKIFIYFEKIANYIYEGTGKSSSFEGFKGICKTIKTSTDADMKSTIKGSLTSIDLAKVEFYPANALDVSGISSSVVGLIFLILYIVLLVNFLKLLLEAYERYVLLGVMFYTCPLAFSCIASETTNDIFQKWVQMVISQFILLICNLFFLGVFYGGIRNVIMRGLNKSMQYSSASEFIIVIIILIAWLIIGQKVDQHLKAIGLSAAQCGGGLSYAILAGINTAEALTNKGTSVAKFGKSKLNSGEGFKNPGAINGGGTINKDKMNAFGANNLNNPNSIFKSDPRKDGVITGAGKAAVANAERMNGELTRDGAKSIWTNAGASVNGLDAKRGVSNMGLDPAVANMAVNAPLPEEKYTAGENGKSGIGFAPGEENGVLNQGLMDSMSLDKNDSIDWESSSFGAGKATFKDSNGEVLGELGDSQLYEASDGAATRNITSDFGAMSMAATPPVVEADQNEIYASIQNSNDYCDYEWRKQSNGSLYGYNSEGVPIAVATPSYINQGDSLYGNVVQGQTASGINYNIQNFNSNGSKSSNEAKISSFVKRSKKIAKSNTLVRKQKKNNANKFI